MKNTFSYQLQAKDKRARAGVFNTPHGDLLTPVFAPVGTQGTVKAVTPDQLEQLGASLILSNTYHLYLRPGDELIAQMGGLHSFMHWENPILTDSGGYQVYSLADSREVDNEGVTFRSHIDGSIHRFTPEKTISIQESLGADIIMAFDQCAEPYDRENNRKAVSRTHTWLERCAAAQTRSDQALFGIVQGGIFPDLRRQSAEYVSSFDLPGNAIGGLSVGETKEELHAVLDVVDAVLPQDKPRYLMGVGTVEDLINGVARGVDIFDCVLPTRLARHRAAMTRVGRLNMANAAFADDSRPIDETCNCYTCQNFSRSYVRHLAVSKEMLSATLLSIHNLFTLIQLTRDLREAILQGKFEEFPQNTRWSKLS